MAFNYNSIYKVFLKYYPNLEKKVINSTLVSVIYPGYKRNEDSDFANEQLNAKRNLSKEVVDAANSLTPEALNENKKIITKKFTNRKANQKIQFILQKIISNDDTLDESVKLTDFNNLAICDFCSYGFKDFISFSLLYATRFTKCSIGVPISDETLTLYDIEGQNEAPCFFIEQDNDYLDKYGLYYKKAVSDLKQIKTILYRQEAVNFYDIYVAPNISTIDPGIMHDKNHRELGGIETTPDKYISTFGKCTTITAPGGFGKSMFLKHLFLCNSIPQLPADLKTDLVPIFIQVRSFIKNDASLEDMLHANISKYLILSKEQFFNDLRHGGFLLLFDGLDELKSTEVENFFNQLSDLTDKYPSNYFVTSSRPSEQCEGLSKFKALKLNGLTLSRAKKMIRKLPNIPKEKINGFIEALDGGEFNRNKQIACNPLLLTLMFMVFMSKGKLPDKTYQFYEKAYEVLYTEHDKVKGFKGRKFYTGLKRIEFSMILSEFCYLTTTTQDYEFTESEIVKVINSSTFKDKISPDDFILDLTDNLNLLYLENDKYHFIHRSFQEYFAANYCICMNDDDYSKLPIWFNDLSKPKKEGVFVFFFSTIGLGVFNLLYEMNPSRFKQFILYPCLNYVLSNEDTLDSYLEYLKKVYVDIEYGDEIAMEPKKHIYSLIFDAFIKDTFAGMYDNGYPDYEEYRDTGYWLLAPPEPNCSSEKIRDVELSDMLDEMEDDEKEIFLETNRIDPDNPEFYDYKIPIDDIIADKDKFSELINIISDEAHDLKIIYRKLKALQK